MYLDNVYAVIIKLSSGPVARTWRHANFGQNSSRGAKIERLLHGGLVYMKCLQPRSASKRSLLV